MDGPSSFHHLSIRDRCPVGERCLSAGSRAVGPWGLHSPLPLYEINTRQRTTILASFDTHVCVVTVHTVTWYSMMRAASNVERVACDSESQTREGKVCSICISFRASQLEFDEFDRTGRDRWTPMCMPVPVGHLHSFHLGASSSLLRGY